MMTDLVASANGKKRPLEEDDEDEDDDDNKGLTRVTSYEPSFLSAVIDDQQTNPTINLTCNIASPHLEHAVRTTSPSLNTNKFAKVKVNEPQTNQKVASTPLINQWLQEHYEVNEASTIPRSSIYCHYVGFCRSVNLEAVNPAGFGKLLRSSFPNIKTRRLGIRGQSKYHYDGIRLKATSRFNSFPVEISQENINHDLSNNREMRCSKEMLPTAVSPLSTNAAISLPSSSESIKLKTSTDSKQTVRIGSDILSIQLPDFSFNISVKPSLEQANSFLTEYQTHCSRLLEFVVLRHQFAKAEKELSDFWISVGNRPHFFSLFECEEFVNLVLEKDKLIYQTILGVTIPCALQTATNLNHLIRYFARLLEGWLASCLSGLPELLSSQKRDLARRFVLQLQKQARLNQLVMNAKNVITLHQQQLTISPPTSAFLALQQMANDWERIDFDLIHSRFAWVCQYADSSTKSYRDEFHRMLSEGQCGIEQTVLFLISFVNKFIENSTGEIKDICEQLLMKWMYYTNLIMNDLSSKCVRSLGNFHLARSLFDEIIFFIVDYIKSEPHKKIDSVMVSLSIFQNSLPSGVGLYTSSDIHILEVDGLQEKRECVGDDEEYARSWGRTEDQMSPSSNSDTPYQFDYHSGKVNALNHNSLLIGSPQTHPPTLPKMTSPLQKSFLHFSTSSLFGNSSSNTPLTSSSISNSDYYSLKMSSNSVPNNLSPLLSHYVPNNSNFTGYDAYSPALIIQRQQAQDTLLGLESQNNNNFSNPDLSPNNSNSPLLGLKSKVGHIAMWGTPLVAQVPLGEEQDTLRDSN